MKSFSRPYLLAGHLAFAVFMFLALWFAEERVLLIDSAYQLFHDINHESILINDSRYSMFLSQLLPWLLIRLHVPLRWVIVAYSASFVLIAYGCFLLSAYVLRHKPAAILMSFTFLGMCATFFHCISETFQLMFFAPLLYALMETPAEGSAARRAARWAGVVVVEALAFFIHPVALFFIPYVVAFRAIDGRRLRFDATAVVVSALFALFTALYLLLGQSGHDESFMPTADTLRHALAHFSSLASFDYFRHRWYIYLFPVVVWLVSLVGYARRRQWLKMALVGLYVLGFFVLSVVVYWQGDGSIGMERTYLPLYFFAGLPFAVDELPRLRLWACWPLFAYFFAMLVVAFVRIGCDMHYYTNRLQEVKQIAAYARAQGQHKLVLTESTHDSLFRIKYWGLALESMLLTARDGADRTVTLYLEPDDFDRSDSARYRDPSIYLSVNWWPRWAVADLNPHYFSLPAQDYMLLEVPDGSYSLSPL